MKRRSVMRRHSIAAMKRQSRQRGFTLIEVLVALSIVATTLIAGLRAGGALVRNAERQSEVMLAQICAENEQVRLRLARQMPDVGQSTTRCEQAGQVFVNQITIQPSQNPNFRRADVLVTLQDHPVLQLSTIVGRY